MKTFKQFLEQRIQNEQMDMPPAIIKYQKELGSPTQLGSYLPGMHLPKDEIKSPEDHIKNAENAKEIELTLKYRMGKNHVKYVKPEVLANALARTKPNVNQVKEILEYLSEYHDYITKEDIKTILNVVPDEIKGYLAEKLEKDRQAHQNKRDNFFRKHYPNLKKGLDGDAGYFDSDSGKGGDYKTHYKSRK